jgi:hypothetical protein
LRIYILLDTEEPDEPVVGVTTDSGEVAEWCLDVKNKFRGFAAFEIQEDGTFLEV